MNADFLSITAKSGHNFGVYKINRDINGNPRYVISENDIYITSDKTILRHKMRTTGLRKYRGTIKPGVQYYVFQSYNIQYDIELIDQMFN